MSSSLFPTPGPSLPHFDSLLVRGPYSPSAPIHLCLSHLLENAGIVLFLTPSRRSFATPLQDFNDGWLTANAAKGQYLSLLSRINIYYPPTIAHWLLLLSLFKQLSSSSAPPNKAVLPHSPSLIVLHEPSAYFTSLEGPQQPDLSQYLQLITTAFSTASFLSPHKDKATPLVLFDSRLEDLRLPIVRPLTPSRRLFTDRPDSPVRQERVEKFVERYFTWVGTVVDEYAEQTPRTPPRHGTFDIFTKERTGPFKLRLDKRLPSEDGSRDNQITVEWSELKGTRKPHSTLKETRFIFGTNE